MQEDKIRALLNEENIPFFGTIYEFEQLSKIVSFYRNKIEESKSPREIIFESWFLFDYLVRMLLLKAFDINKFENEDFDPLYDFLPQSFEKCLKSFETILKQQRKLYDEKKHPNTIRNTPLVTMPINFFMFLNKKDPKKLEELLNDFNEYEEKYESVYFERMDDFESEEKITEVVSRFWIETCQNIDDEWFKNIRKLNSVRNKAAHIFKQDIIYESFGINGTDKLQKLKNEIELIVNKSFYFK